MDRHYLLIQLNVRPYLAALLLIFFLLFYNVKLFIPQAVLAKTAADYTNEYALKWTVSRISDEYLPPGFKKPNSPNDVYKGQANIPVKETATEKISNIASLVGLLALISGIILFKEK